MNEVLKYRAFYPDQKNPSFFFRLIARVVGAGFFFFLSAPRRNVTNRKEGNFTNETYLPLEQEYKLDKDKYIDLY